MTTTTKKTTNKSTERPAWNTLHTKVLNTSTHSTRPSSSHSTISLHSQQSQKSIQSTPHVNSIDKYMNDLKFIEQSNIWLKQHNKHRHTTQQKENNPSSNNTVLSQLNTSVKSNSVKQLQSPQSTRSLLSQTAPSSISLPLHKVTQPITRPHTAAVTKPITHTLTNNDTVNDSTHDTLHNKCMHYLQSTDCTMLAHSIKVTGTHITALLSHIPTPHNILHDIQQLQQQYNQNTIQPYITWHAFVHAVVELQQYNQQQIQTVYNYCQQHTVTEDSDITLEYAVKLLDCSSDTNSTNRANDTIYHINLALTNNAGPLPTIDILLSTVQLLHQTTQLRIKQIYTYLKSAQCTLLALLHHTVISDSNNTHDWLSLNDINTLYYTANLGNKLLPLLHQLHQQRITCNSVDELLHVIIDTQTQGAVSQRSSYQSSVVSPRHTQHNTTYSNDTYRHTSVQYNYDANHTQQNYTVQQRKQSTDSNASLPQFQRTMSGMNGQSIRISTTPATSIPHTAVEPVEQRLDHVLELSDANTSTIPVQSISEVKDDLVSKLQAQLKEQELFQQQQLAQLQSLQQQQQEREQQLKLQAEQAAAELKLQQEQAALLLQQQQADTQSKLEAELKAKVEAEVALKLQQATLLAEQQSAKELADKQAAEKAEAERLKAVKQAELQKQAEIEAKAKANLEAKQQAELQAKQQAEADAKEKAELEAKQKAENEAKLKAEKQLQAQKQAELQAKQQAEAKSKADAEAKAKPEEAEKNKKPVIPDDQLCELCDEAQAVLHCNECDMQFCQSNGCDGEMHRPKLQAGHQRTTIVR